MIYATITDSNGIDYEVRGVYFRGLRSTSYYDPDEPPYVEDVEARPEGCAPSFPWQDPEDLGLNLDACVQALHEGNLE